MNFCAIDLGHPEWAATPVAPGPVFLFLANKYAQGNVGSSLASLASAIAFRHKLSGFPDPTLSESVRRLLLGARKLRPSVDLRFPICKATLHKLVDALPHITSSFYLRALLKSLFLVCFHGFFRVGELIQTNQASHTVVHLSDLFFYVTNESNRSMKVLLRHSKNKDTSGTTAVNIAAKSTYCPMEATRQYLIHRGTNEGPLYILPGPLCFSRAMFDTQLKKCLKFVGLNPDVYKGHSFRIGACTEAAALGWSDAQLRSLGRWKSDAFKKYIRLHVTHSTL